MQYGLSKIKQEVVNQGYKQKLILQERESEKQMAQETQVEDQEQLNQLIQKLQQEKKEKTKRYV